MSDERLSLFRYSARLIAGRGGTHDSRCISTLLKPRVPFRGFFLPAGADPATNPLLLHHSHHPDSLTARFTSGRKISL